MAIPYVYAPIKPQDFTLNPFQVNKRYSISNTELITTESGFTLVSAVHTNRATPIGASQATNDPTNSFDGTYQHVRWWSINHLYYKYPYDAVASFEHTNRRYTYKFLNYSASILSIPYFRRGETIRPGSVSIQNTTYNYTLSDDLNGNLYDPSISTGSFTKRYALVGYWGFNDEYKRFRFCNGTVTKGTLDYYSYVYQVSEPSVIRNITFDKGVPINNTASGMHAEFSGQSYIMTHDTPDMNFTSEEDFTLACWVKVPVSQSVVSKTTNTLISKRGSIRKQVYGFEQKYNANDILVTTEFVSSSVTDEDIDVYPYDLDIYNQTDANVGKLRFRRSDGINIVTLTATASVNNGGYHHVAAVRNSGTLYLYVDGVLHTSASDTTTHPINKHSLMFGSKDMSFNQAFSGSLDEIRIYDYAVPAAGIATLANNTNASMYQTAVVGNAFYRMGNIVITSLDPRYMNMFTGTWRADWKSTHTVYHYEILCRIKKGAFNLTMNPTARISPKSDLLTNDMTGSLLLPYATTIGYYNDSGELMAVAKLGRPLQMRDDVDINILTGFDI